MTRREMVVTTASTLAWLSSARLTGAEPVLKNMGGEGPGFANRSRAGGFDIVERCHDLGLGVVRVDVPQGGPDAVRALRKKLDSYGMRCIVSAAPPRTDAAVAAYDTSSAAARGARAVAAHAACAAAGRELGAGTTPASFTARRYEEFDSFEAFKTSFDAHKKSVE